MRAGNRTAPVQAGVLVWREEVSDDTISYGDDVGGGGYDHWSRVGERGGAMRGARRHHQSAGRQVPRNRGRARADQSERRAGDLRF
ncbi:hypothetical protein MPLDJ20_90186 [Mesorhizobium plurifarium]|uniref:Uncharacterized protein n=1 Tax=Mesorhizobium plurifarium TaxID=69974 RepID=A0A090FRT9_MESPL|nr:hypothetical protein MPLDJ20_90186 [Mesorhizobium plurifarium]